MNFIRKLHFVNHASLKPKVLLKMLTKLTVCELRCHSYNIIKNHYENDDDAEDICACCNSILIARLLK